MIVVPSFCLVLVPCFDMFLTTHMALSVKTVSMGEKSGIINDGYGLTGGCAGASKYGFQRVGGSSRPGDGRYDPVGFC